MVKTDRKPESSSRYTLRLPANLSTVTLRRLLKKAFNHMQLVLCKHDRNDAVVEASWWLLTSVYFTHEDVAVPCNNTLSTDICSRHCALHNTSLINPTASEAAEHIVDNYRHGLAVTMADNNLPYHRNVSM